MVNEFRADALHVSLGGRPVVHDAVTSLRGGELVGLVGPNGAGKTTLLRALAGLIPYRGSVMLDGDALDVLTARERARRIAFLPQGHHAHWPLTVEALVGLGRLPYRRLAAAMDAADHDAMQRAMEQADVTALRGRRVDRLSGGERARVMLARALAVEAPVLLVDEPTTSLDPYHQLQIMEVLQGYAAQRRLVVAVLHDLSLAARYCNRLLLMHRGRLLAQGPPEAVLGDRNLRESFRITALSGSEQGTNWLLPWGRTPAD